MPTKKRKKSINREKVKKRIYEIFKIKRKGKEKTVSVKGFEIIESSSKKQIKNENKILRNFFFIIIGVIAFIVIGYFIVDNMRSFEYKGVEFEIVKFCDADPCLILFQTKLPVVKERGEKAEYNFFLRNDPRDLEDIKFDGNIKLLNTMVVNSKNDFNCDGDGIIAMANLVKLYEVAGTRVIKNEELDCPINNEYIYFELSEGGETKIINPISSCYVLRVNDCEIIPVTEKFMVETLVEINKMLE